MAEQISPRTIGKGPDTTADTHTVLVNATTLTRHTTRPFGWRDKVGYMFGDFGNDFTFILQASFFMLFYTDVVGINPAHVGILLLVARIIDGFTDVGMGMLVDLLPVQAGKDKFKRWIKFIMIPVALTSALMYMSFVGNFESYGLRLTWMCVSYFLWGSFCYTAINIPYGSMASVISADADDRSQLSVFRSTGATLAQLIIMAALPALVYVDRVSDNGQMISVLDGGRMTLGAVICSVCAVICYIVLYVNVEERVHSTEEKTCGASIGQTLKALVTNKALGGLIIAALLLLLANLFLTGMLGYLFKNYFDNGKLLSPANLAGLLPPLVLIVLAPIMAKKWGKAEVCSIAMLIGGAVFIAAYFLKLTNPFLYILFYAVGTFAIAIFNYLVWAFITDVIDYQDVKTRKRDDATVYASYSWARKLGQALAGGLTGVALTWIGYNSEAAREGIQQSASVLDSIYLLANLVPGIGCILVGLALWFLYPLKKHVVESNIAELQRRRAQETAH